MMCSSNIKKKNKEFMLKKKDFLSIWARMIQEHDAAGWEGLGCKQKENLK